jgi:hypothetical protein
MINPEERMINLCNSIKCPFFNPKMNSFGCQKYTVAVRCHLLRSEDGSERTELERSSNQYYLSSYPDNVNLAELAEQNAKFLAQPEIIEDLEIDAEFGRGYNC